MADVELQSLELKVKGNAGGATKSLNALIKTLEKLDKATAGGCGLDAVAKGLAKVDKASSKVSASNNSSAASFGKLAIKVGAAAIALKKVGKTIASWINESNEYTENMNLFSVAMGQYASSAMDYANKVSDAMGIDTSEWIRAQGVFMTLATGFGVAGDRAATMSQQLTQLGYDISSFYNISSEEAMTKLKSGLAGELEPLRSLGYDLSMAKLEAVALSKGIDKSVSSMTQAEKAELRYYAIMTQVTTVQGDMARTLEDPANQLRIFRAQVDMAARSLGNIFIPALNAILPYAIAAVKVVRLLADAIAGLFGYAFPEVEDSPVNGLTNGATDASDAIDDATDSAKKLKRTLLGIDELNVMSDTSSSSDADYGTGFDFELPTYDFISEAAESRVNQIVEEMKQWLGITGEITSWSDLFDSRLGSILTSAGLIGLAILGWKVTTEFMAAISAIRAIMANPTSSVVIGVTVAILGITIAFDGLESAIKDGLSGFNFAEIIGGSILGAGAITLLGSKLAVWLESAFMGKAVSYAIAAAGQNLGLGTVAATGAALTAAVAGIVAGIPMFFVGIYDAIKNGISWLSGILIPAGATAAGAGIGAIIGAVGGPVTAGLGALIGLAVGALTDVVILVVQNWDTIVEWCSKACSSIGQFFVDLWGDIVAVWNTVAGWFDTKVIQPVVGFFVGLWNTISGAAVSAWNAIVGVWATVTEWFDVNITQPICNFFVAMWDGIVYGASACWNGIVAFFTPAIEWFSALFNEIRMTLSDIFYNIGVIASGCWEIIKLVWEIASDWFNTSVVQPISEFFIALWEGISKAAVTAWEALKSAWESATTWFRETIVVPIGNFFSALWAGICEAAIIAWGGIQNAFSAISAWVDEKVIKPVGTFFTNLWTGFLDGAKAAWVGVKEIFSKVGSYFSDVFSKAWAGVVKVFSIAGDIFVDIKNGIVEAFKVVVNGIIKGLNSVIAIPFNDINAALKLVRDVNILGLTPFSSVKEIHVPQIPYLAEGGMLDNSGQLFVANEAGPELVGSIGNRTAVMNNDQIVSAVSQGVYRAVVQAMAQSGDQTVEAKVNDKVLFEAVVNRARQETMRRGYNPLLGGA